MQNGTAAVDDTLYMGSEDYTTTDDIPTEMAPPSPVAVGMPTADEIHTSLNKPGSVFTLVPVLFKMLFHMVCKLSVYQEFTPVATCFHL